MSELICGFCKAKAVQPIGADDYLWILPADSPLRKLEAENERLREALGDWVEMSEIVLTEKCAPDEVHCGCVVFLRKRIKELEDFTCSETALLKKALHEIKRLGLVKLHDDAFFFDKARFAENRLAEIVATANDALNALSSE